MSDLPCFHNLYTKVFVLRPDGSLEGRYAASVTRLESGLVILASSGIREHLGVSSMRSVPQNRASASATALLSPSIRAALALLLPPEDAQPPDGSHPGIYAIAISRLRAAGLSDTELRWLIGLQLLEPQNTFRGSAVVRRRHGVRADQRSEAAAYQLTHAGLCWAREILKDKRLTPSVSPNGTPPDYGNLDRPQLPFWDADNRTLWWGDQILLRFHRRHAPNLEPLLTAFQNQHWKAFIADPLAQEKESKFNPRLHDAIKYLNRRLRGKPIRFHGNGDGKSVRWEAVEVAPRRSAPHMS